MDEATRLIGELQDKLAELDNRVAAYRLDMVSEFTRYSEKLLQNVPEHVSSHVSRVIAESLSNFPALNLPGLSSSRSASLTSVDSARKKASKSPPPVLPHTSGTPKGLQKSHEREKEFHGLFTPSYLPLLDSAERPLHSPPTSPPAASSGDKSPALAVGDSGTQPPDDSQNSLRPVPTRRATDTSIDSLGSDSSTSKIRKSALRRSSNSPRSADSPRRRVRFEVKGEEVLPSSSPQAASTATTATGIAATTTLEDPGVASAGYTFALADDSYLPASLADLEDEDEDEDEEQEQEEPPPRKVSSSQALRALSKEPLDNGTVWTVVNPTSDSDDQSIANSDIDTVPEPMSAEDTVQAPTMPAGQLPDRTKAQLAGKLLDEKAQAKYQDMEDDSEDSSDEETLFMVSRKKKPNPPVAKRQEPSSPVRSQPIPVKAAAKPPSYTPTSTPPLPSVKPNHGFTEQEAYNDNDDDDDDLFVLEAADDDESLKKATSNRSSPRKHMTEDAEDEPEPEPEPKPEREATTDTEDEISSSPAVEIAPQRPAIPPRAPENPEGPIPASNIGSYKGRPLSMGPAKDQKVLEQLKELEQAPPFFVGSVNGRSGPDASNVKSYRASLHSPSRTGMPGSLTERLLAERAMRGGKDESDVDEEERYF